MKTAIIGGTCYLSLELRFCCRVAGKRHTSTRLSVMVTDIT